MLDVAEGDRAGGDSEGAVDDLLHEGRQLVEHVADGHRTLAAADDLHAGGPQRSGRDGSRRAGGGADLDPGQRLILAPPERSRSGCRRRAGPQVVKDHVDVSGGFGQVPGHDVRCGGEVDEPDGAQGFEPAGIAARGADVRGAKVPATRTAVRPALPVAPRTSTRCPGPNRALRRSASQEDMTAFTAGVTTTGSILSGSSTLRRGSTAASSAMDPAGVSGRKNYISLPSLRRPTPSTPGYQGSTAAAGVVRAVSLGAPGVQPRGERLHQLLLGGGDGSGTPDSGAGRRTT